MKKKLPQNDTKCENLEEVGQFGECGVHFVVNSGGGEIVLEGCSDQRVDIWQVRVSEGQTGNPFINFD